MHTIKLFQKNYQLSVFFLFEDSLENGLKEGYIYPEWQIVQYVLGSFVAMLNNLIERKFDSSVFLKLTGLISDLHFCYGRSLVREGSQLKSELAEPKWLAKRKLKNLWSLINQTQREFVFLIGDVKPETEEFVIKQLETFFSVFRWSIEVDLQKDFSGDGLTDVYKKHIGTEGIFTRMLFMVRLGSGKIHKNLTGDIHLGYITSFNAVECVLRTFLTAYPNHTKYESRNIFKLFELLDRKLRILLGQSQDFGRLKQSMDGKLVQEAKQLTFPQLLWIVMSHFLFLLVLRREEECIHFTPFPLRESNLPFLNEAYESCNIGDFASLMRLFAQKLNKGEQEHPGIVHIRTARKFPLSYKVILELKVKGEKTAELPSLTCAGENIWTPIMFCANCSKLECDLKMCKFCKGENSKRTPVCWFCSEECENKYLEAGHSKKHEEDVLEKLGLS
jgi:hypothetical protein